MKEKHIIEVLDSAALASLSHSELDEVRAHARDCVPCSSAFEAAQFAAVVIKERAQVVVQPSPFFQTRVLAALREQLESEYVPALWRLWKSARALVSSMVVTTAALAALSFMISPPETVAFDQTASSAYSADSVILDQREDQLTYEQVLNAIYTELEEK